MLTSGRYSGNPVSVHRALVGLERTMFDRWLTLFEATATRLFTPNQASRFVTKARRIAASLQLAVFHRPGAPPDGLAAWCRFGPGALSPMRLTAYTDYTLRTLMYLAVNTGRNTTIAEIAASYVVSETHLMKIVHHLGLAGDIETIRGRNGGLRLAKPPAAINLGAIVRRTEPDMDLVACFDATARCAISKACVLQTVLHESLAAFLSVLDRYTLADLVAPHRELAMQLGVPA